MKLLNKVSVLTLLLITMSNSVLANEETSWKIEKTLTNGGGLYSENMLYTWNSFMNIDFCPQVEDNCCSLSMWLNLKLHGIDVNEKDIYEYAKSEQGGCWRDLVMEYVNTKIENCPVKMEEVINNDFSIKTAIDHGSPIMVAVKSNIYYDVPAADGLHELTIIGYTDNYYIVIDTNCGYCPIQRIKIDDYNKCKKGTAFVMKSKF